MRQKTSVLILFLCMLSCQSLLAVTKHALIFAIGNYPLKTNGWQPLSSLKDAEMLKKKLQDQHFEDIKIVQDGEATVQGIGNAFDQLINNVNAGDVVIVHFSCHGRQLATTSNKVGGYDQCIVTYNAINEK